MNEQENNDPWIVRPPKAKFEPLPVGFYVGPFKGIEDLTLKDGKVKWRFSWEVQSGDHKGKVATALADKDINPAAQTGVLISGLLGRDLTAGESVKAALDACKGKVYMVGVQPGPKGGKPQVRSVGKPPQM